MTTKNSLNDVVQAYTSYYKSYNNFTGGKKINEYTGSAENATYMCGKDGYQYTISIHRNTALEETRIIIEMRLLNQTPENLNN